MKIEKIQSIYQIQLENGARQIKHAANQTDQNNRAIDFGGIGESTEISQMLLISFDSSSDFESNMNEPKFLFMIFEHPNHFRPLTPKLACENV